ncbi:amidohydrolase family protein [Brevundimonas sp. Root1279]|uniref:amidohydrolase family protein n=1 Tax=Brevundimonas sp. Root1279 TaxID=1736443 RepID=UPI0006F27A48|nr:amidohydrolase family protein [Brevundimonas sp. Root1279]KQW80789.1 hypothetical protein ASC65_12495 [Brevundimonas sp. Root1279]
MIDAHQHFWTLGRPRPAWPTPDLKPIYRDVLPDEFELLARQLGVTGSIAVQSQPTDADTRFLLGLAKDNPFILGVVGWVDLEAPTAPARLKALAAQPKLCGVRPMLQGLEQDDWIETAPIEAAVRALIEHDLVFDALVHPRHLAPLLAFAERWPALAIVIDHGAKPPIGHDLRAWDRGMAALAALGNVSCKLSGLMTEVQPGHGQDAVPPVIDRLSALFGPERLIWGSDWPVLNLATRYEPWLELCRVRIPSRDREAVFGGNARRVYGLAG